jgi:hypothetical protein
LRQIGLCRNASFSVGEVYVRPDQTVYLTGFPDDPVRVTEEPGQEEVRPEAIQRIEAAVQQASSNSESIIMMSSFVVVILYDVVVAIIGRSPLPRTGMLFAIHAR